MTYQICVDPRTTYNYVCFVEAIKFSIEMNIKHNIFKYFRNIIYKLNSLNVVLTYWLGSDVLTIVTKVQFPWRHSCVNIT